MNTHRECIIMQNIVNHIVEDTNVGFWDWNISENIQYCNAIFTKILGIQLPSVSTSTAFWLDTLVVEDKVLFITYFQALLTESHDTTFTCGLRFLHPSGRVVDTMVCFNILEKDSAGKVQRITGNFWDITAQKQWTTTLQRTESLYSKSSELARIGGWELEIASKTLFSTKIAKQIMGLDEYYTPALEEILAFCKKEVDKQRFLEAIAIAQQEHKSFELEFEIITAQQKNIWIRTTGEAHIVGGICDKIIGVFQEITKQKQAEERLNVIFEYSTDAHLLFDETGILDCNTAAVKMLGCSNKEQLLACHPAQFSPEFQPDGRRSDEKSREMDALATQKGYHRFEWLHTRFNGEIFLAEVSLNPVKINDKRALLVVWHDITERKIAEEKLKQSETILSETQSLTHSASWVIDLESHISCYSAEAFRIFELNTPSLALSAEETISLIHPNDRDLYLSTLQHASMSGEPFSIDLRIVLPNGHIKYLQKIGKPTVDTQGNIKKIYGAILDVTKSKKIEQAIHLKQEQLRNFIEYTPAAIAMFDKNMNYIAASNIWKVSYRLDDLEIIGKNHYEVFPEINDTWKAIHQRCLKGEVLNSNEDSFTRLDGREEWLRWEIRPWFEKEDEIGGIIMFTEVITEQIEAKSTLIKAKEQAEQAAIAKTQFLSTMSHEIRTPMNAVIGITHLLMQNSREDQLEYLKILKFSAENLLVLINDILDFNKIEAGKIEFEEVDFSIKDLLGNIRAALLQKAVDKGIQLKLMIDDDLPEAVKGDSVRIGQIITNLVSNAVKFTDKGKVTISAALVKKDSEFTTINFEVRDTGIGIPQEKWEHIFESFTQASSETTRKYGGTGLGLTITKRLLEMQGSKINLESTPNEGSVFYFDLKLRNSSFQFKRIETLTPQQQYRSLKGLKLLIADDNQINIIVAKQFLKRWEVECDVAENGLLALQMVQQTDYDLVLMDLQMPELDGYEATRQIRSLGNEYYSQLPIIALTASAMLDIKDKAFAVGMNDYISKPFNPDELYRKISLHSEDKTKMSA